MKNTVSLQSCFEKESLFLYCVRAYRGGGGPSPCVRTAYRGGGGWGSKIGKFLRTHFMDGPLQLASEKSDNSLLVPL